MPTLQEQFWKGEFGSQYVERNQVNWSLRVPFWEDIVMWTEPRSVLEVGCNIGANLMAIKSIDPWCDVAGVDVNKAALNIADRQGLDAVELSGFEVGKKWPETFDLVFTAGVLIHIAPEGLDGMMQSIIDASRRYVLAVEYASDQEEHIEYRGYTDRLWRRPFGKLYEAKGLNLIEQRDAGSGFDRCTAWLMEKV